MTDPNGDSTSGSRGAGRIAMVVAGVVVAMAGVAMSTGGGVLVWAHGTQRDAAGYYTSSPERFVTGAYALTSSVDLGRAPGELDWTVAHPVGTVRIQADGGSRPVFVGIGPQVDVDRWLTGVAHERVLRPNFGPFEAETALVAGTVPPAPPLSQPYWAASTSGSGVQTLYWPSQGGRWTVVVMNADAGAGVSADVTVGARTAVLLPIGLGGGAFGLLLLGAAAALLFFGLRAHVTAGVTAAPAYAAPPGTYLARLDGRLDPGLSRWLWLVKWLLVIPHVVVLAFLWLAVAVLTMVAWFAILFTGRYPRSIFDFNLGVMRWSWRVSFYAVSAFGTDRYPPFSLGLEPDYPATFTVDYPEELSRRLVLVKSWLLALPHYLVVAVFAGGWGVGWNRGAWRVAGGGGLIALLAVIAAVVLAVRDRYPESIFDFLMGPEPLVLPRAGLRRADAGRVPAVPARHRRPRPGERPGRPDAGSA